MDLWIRSQDKENFIKVIGIRVLENQIQIQGEAGGVLLVGGYKTKERALEVLDDILNFIKLNFECSGSAEYVDVKIKKEILTNMTKIYEMPKE